MIINLPAVKKTVVDKPDGEFDVKVEKYEIPFRVDTSAWAEYRYNQHFKEQFGYDNLFDFARAVTTKKQHDLIEVLAVAYCFLDSKDVPTFEDFVRLFD